MNPQGGMAVFDMLLGIAPKAVVPPAVVTLSDAESMMQSTRCEVGGFKWGVNWRKVPILEMEKLGNEDRIRICWAASLADTENAPLISGYLVLPCETHGFVAEWVMQWVFWRAANAYVIGGYQGFAAGVWGIEAGDLSKGNNQYKTCHSYWGKIYDGNLKYLEFLAKSRVASDVMIDVGRVQRTGVVVSTQLTIWKREWRENYDEQG